MTLNLSDDVRFLYAFPQNLQRTLIINIETVERVQSVDLSVSLLRHDLLYLMPAIGNNALQMINVSVFAIVSAVYLLHC